LADITTIEDGFEQNDFHSQFNRQPSIELAIYRIGNQSPLDIPATVQAVMDDFESNYPRACNAALIVTGQKTIVKDSHC